MKKLLFKIFLGLIFLCSFRLDSALAQENEINFGKYFQSVYNGSNGLTGGIANDVEQTKDGLLWIGTYSGLYRYNGRYIQAVKNFESVKTVNCLYTDEAGRMWIGTNDNGLSILVNNEIMNTMNADTGLNSNSVRDIVADSNGNYYVATTGALSILGLSSGLNVKNTLKDIVYTKKLSANKNGHVVAVTNSGKLYLIKDAQVQDVVTSSDNNKNYNSAKFDINGNLYAGTSDNKIDVFILENDKLLKVNSYSCEGLDNINNIAFDHHGGLFICSDTGVGYIDKGGNYTKVNTGSFDTSIENMLVDYQENLWFVSSRQGLLRFTPTIFHEIKGKYNLSSKIVNTVTKWNDTLYIGTDVGLDISSDAKSNQLNNLLISNLKNIRIRSLKVDSKNHLWAATMGFGLWEITEDGLITIYDKKQNTTGTSFRSIIETRDYMVAAGDLGITFIKDGRVVATIDSNNNPLLTNPKILCVEQRWDDTILAGTDGNGIAVIKDNKVVKTLKKKDGLSSEIILRLVSDRKNNGTFIVTGNGLCYMDNDDKITVLDNFPYYNNFDLVIGKNGKLFVTSSAGLYILNKEALLKGEKLDYELFDSHKGLIQEFVPNAWNYIDEDNNYFIASKNGIVKLNLDDYEIKIRSYRILLDKIKVDGADYSLNVGEPFYIPKNASRVEITPELINYTINDPYVSVYLEGIDSKPRFSQQSNMTSNVYTNLPAGSYTFHVAMYSNSSGNKISENTYTLIKESELHNTWWFRLYFNLIIIILACYLTWLIVRSYMVRIVNRQKARLEKIQKQLKMTNETIITIANAVDAKDERTSQHSARVSEYSVMIAKKIGYTKDQCENLRNIALLHDIGKIGIPDSVLNKPAKLTNEEFEIMKTHVVRGAEILKNFTLIENVAEGALYHHERYDGNGYVHGLKGEEIPLNARIIGIADAFDAMTSNRVYRNQLNIEFVIAEMMRCRGKQFDPKLTDIMIGLVADGSIDIEKLYGVNKNAQ